MNGRGREIIPFDNNGLRGVGINRQGIAVIASRTNENLSVHTQADRQPRQMATYWFCIRNKALKFLIHFIGDALIKYSDYNAKCSRLLVELPPLLYFNQVSEWLDGSSHCADGPFVSVYQPCITNHLSLCLFRPVAIPAVNGKCPGEIRQQMHRAGIRRPQRVEVYRNVCNACSDGFGTTHEIAG